MSVDMPAVGRGLELRELEAEARYARERYQLYKARGYSSRLTSPVRLRELERASELAERRLERAEASPSTIARWRT